MRYSWLLEVWSKIKFVLTFFKIFKRKDCGKQKGDVFKNFNGIQNIVNGNNVNIINTCHPKLPVSTTCVTDESKKNISQKNLIAKGSPNQDSIFNRNNSTISKRKPIIISFLTTILGSGKTTMALHVAHAFALQGYTVKIVDGCIDPKVGVGRNPLNFRPVIIHKICDKNDLSELKNQYWYDLIIIDGPPEREHCVEAISISDLVLIPIIDTDSRLRHSLKQNTNIFINLAEILKAKMQSNSNFKAAFVRNCVNERLMLNGCNLNLIKNLGLPIFQNFMKESVNYRSFSVPTVFSKKSNKLKPFCLEINNILDEIRDYIRIDSLKCFKNKC